MAQPTVDASEAQSLYNGGSSTLTHTSFVHAGGLLLWCGGAGYSSTQRVPSSVSAGGTAMTKLVELDDAGAGMGGSIWVCDKAAGTFNIVLTMSGGYAEIGSIARSIPAATVASVTGSHTVAAAGSGTSGSDDIPSDADELVCDMCVVRRFLTDPATLVVGGGAGRAEDENISIGVAGSGAEVGASHADGANPDVTMDWTFDNNYWAVMGVSIASAGGGGPTSWGALLAGKLNHLVQA